MKRVAVGISGGVDSAVAAYILKKQGYEVIGVFMKNWEEEEGGFCTASTDYEDAKSVCLKLDIPIFSVNFAKQYWDNVFEYFLAEYKAGRTPNPDVMCNSEIKFKAYLNYVTDNLGADYIATGHYVRTEKKDGKTYLLRGEDANKDQSYFLSFLSEKQIENALFPIGDIEKPEVRRIAEELGLRVANKKDSTGICFIGERNFREFLLDFIPAQNGVILDGDTNKKVGEHIGLMYYTIGQRRGLGIGGCGTGERWFVCDKDLENNVLYVVQGANNPKLYKNGFKSNKIHFINNEKREKEFNCTVKYRYRQGDVACKVTLLEDGGCRVLLENKGSGVAPGQVGVFYQGDVCLGGAIIDEVI